MGRYLDPTNDILFKKIFGDAERVKEFLNNILGLPEEYRIQKVTFIPTEELENVIKGKKRIFDLKVRDKSGNWYIIEMQKGSETSYSKRVQYYSAPSYVQQLKTGVESTKLLPIVVVSLIKTEIFDSNVPCISFHKILENETNKDYLFDIFYVFIELSKFDKRELSTVTDEWLHFLKCAKQEDEPPQSIKSDKVREAYHTIRMYNITPEDYNAYVRSELADDAEEIAMAEQFAKGKVEGKVEIAKEMLNDNEPIDKIVKYSKLSAEEITKLKAKLKKH